MQVNSPIRDPHRHPCRLPSPPAAALRQAAALFRAAGDVERLRLLAALGDSERCVTELAAGTGARLPAVSQRLRVLRAEGLVEDRREGKHRYYRLVDAHVAGLIDNAIAHAAEHHRHDRR